MKKVNKKVITFIIIETEHIKVNVKDNNQQIKEIKLNEKDINNNYNLNIKFYENEYIICLDEKEENVINNIIENIPTNKEYKIQFQNEYYKLQAKHLLVMIIDKFLQIIKKEFIIEGIEFEIETENEEI